MGAGPVRCAGGRSGVDRIGGRVVRQPIPTAGLTYEDREALLNQVRAQIAEELSQSG